MHSRTYPYLWWLVAVGVFLLSTPAAAQDESHAGVVIIAAGDFVAQAEGQAPRTLKRRSKFFVGDTLHVGADAKAQIRFRDGTIISLTEGTELKVEAFRYSEDAGPDEVSNIVTLLKGGFRTITGAVAKKNREAYQVRTPVATIGVRGTNYSAVLADSLYVGVWQGGITVKNDGGGLDLGADQSYTFAQIATPKQKPKGLLTAPAVLLETVDAPAPDAEDQQAEDQQAAAQDQSGNEQASDTDGGTGQTAAAEADAEASQTASTEDGAQETAQAPAAETTTEDGASIDGTLADTSDSSLAAWGSDTSADAALTDTADTTTALQDTTNTVIDSSVTDTTCTTGTCATTTDTVVTTVTSDPDLRLSDAEEASLTFYGLAIVGGAGANDFFSGKASSGQAGSPVFTDNGLLPGESGFATTIPHDVVRQGGAPTSVVAWYPDYKIALGYWDGMSSPFYSQVDETDATVTVNYNDALFWVTAEPTPATTIGAMTGQYAYFGVSGFVGGANSGVFDGMRNTTVVDFATGAVTGRFGVLVGPTAGSSSEAWKIDYTGFINGYTLDLNVVTWDGNTANPNGSRVMTNDDGELPVSGFVEMVLSGSNANALGAIFDLQATTLGPNTGNEYDIDGAFVSLRDLRLSVTEVQNLYKRTGVAFFEGAGGFTVIGDATIPNASGDFVLVDDQIDSATGFSGKVIRSGSAILITPTVNTVSGFTVEWGEWNTGSGAIQVYEDGTNPTSSVAMNNNMLWMTVEGAPFEAITNHAANSVVGYWTGTPMAFMGRDNNGVPISNLLVSTMIDFASGQVSGTTLTADVSADQWSVNFPAATLHGESFDLGGVGIGSVVGQSVDGKLFGVLTGNNAEGIAGAFDLQTQTGSKTLNGFFLTTTTLP